ncbi:SDR family NAD(P)-dependent oxidoreductase [Croceicoccus sediminis]|uniref:SDR family NAD(P)-dependent oxidoreductase n=1 Tax=Croceicoccus sediminis TaxID=2571150 RepID=UPI001478DFE6|nr:glucose 1-dehydrogenase [Croceicoccus sediminis]
MADRLKDKVVLVTGAARNLGAVFARKIAGEGAHVFLADILADQLEQTTADVAARYGKASAIPLDVTQEDSWIAAMRTVEDKAGRLDVLVNNAGLFASARIQDQPLDEWERCFAVNARGTFLGCKHAHPLLKKSGGGAIVNISSSWGLTGRANFGAYSAAKAAVRMLTKSAAADFAEDRIRVNSIHPGVHETDLSRDFLADPQQREFLLGKVPLDRAGDPEELANAVIFFASDETPYMTGAELAVDGGYTAI